MTAPGASQGPPNAVPHNFAVGFILLDFLIFDFVPPYFALQIELKPVIMTDASTRPNSTVFVGGLDTKYVTASILSEAFIPFGEIVDISLPKPEAPSSTDLHRGFGYVEFEEAVDAKEAIDNMDQSELYGRVIKVAMAKPDRKDAGGPSVASTTAVWEQEGYLEKYGEQERMAEPVVDDRPEDPMQILEDLDVAGPKPS